MTQIYYHLSDLSPELQAHMCVCLLDIFTRMSSGHFKLHMSKTEPLIFPHKPLTPRVFPYSVNGNGILSDAQNENWGIILDSTLVLHPHQSISKSQRFYFQHLSRIQPLITPPLLPPPLVQPHHLCPKRPQNPSLVSLLLPTTSYSQHSH